MKKIILLFAVLVLMIALPAASDNLNVKIIDIEGSVTIMKANGAELQAQTGQILGVGDRVITGSRSICDLEFAPKTYSRLGEMSDMTISQANLEAKKRLFGSSNKKQINLNLSKGNLLSKIGKLGASENFSVKTPTAVVGVRGTIFNTASSPAGTNVSVFQGSVVVTNLMSNISSVVPAGQSLSVSSSPSSSGAGEQTSIPAAEVKAIAEIAGAPAAPQISAQIVKTTEQLINQPTIITKPVSKNSVIINFK
ncbi:MAG TPA: FecR family protein [bacterium]|nr:FecR family protein [bacterium]